MVSYSGCAVLPGSQPALCRGDRTRGKLDWPSLTHTPSYWEDGEGCLPAVQQPTLVARGKVHLGQY